MLKSSTPTSATNNMDYIDSYDNTQTHHRETLTLASLLSIDVESVPKLASVTEWLDLMCRSERRTGISLLTDDQKESIRQFDTELVDETLHLNVAEFLQLIQRLAQCGPDDYMSSETSSVMQPFNSPATPPPNGGEYRPSYLEPPTATAAATNPTRSRSLTPRQQQQQASSSASPRPQASSSLDHRQRTTHLLNQVQQRLQRSDRHRDEHDNDSHHDDDDQDAGRVSPSTNHPSVSEVSSLDEFNDHIRPKHHPIVTFQGTKGKSKQDDYFMYNYESDTRPTTSLSRHQGDERRWQEAERRLESLTKSYDERMGQMEVELGNMRHETLMYKATIRDYQASDKENKTRIEELEKAIESATLKGNTQRQTIDDLESELKLYTDQTEELKERLSTKEKELSHHVKKYEQLRSDMEELERAQEELTQLRTELSRQYHEVEEQRTRSKNLEAENENLKENIDLLKTELDESRPTGDLYGLKPLQTLDAELAGTIPVNGTMQDKLEKLANERDEYKAQASEERNHANELYQQVDSLAQERDEYKREAFAAIEEAGKASQKYKHLQDENQRLKEQMVQLQEKRRSMRNKVVPASDAGSQCDLVPSKPYQTIRRLSTQLQEQEDTIKRLIETTQEQALEVERSKRVNWMAIFLALLLGILSVVILEAVVDWLLIPSTLGIEDTDFYSQYPVYEPQAAGIRKWMVAMLDFGDDMSILIQ